MSQNQARRDTGIVDIDGAPIFEGDEVECLQWEPDAPGYHVFNGGVIVCDRGEFYVGVTGVPLWEYKAVGSGCEVRRVL